MEKYENIIKIEEIRRLAENKEYNQAAKIVDTMDISKIRATTDLSSIADVLIKKERYEEAIEVLNKIYEKSISRRVVFQLLEVSIKRNNVLLSKRYYDEYIYLAPNDSTKYIFQYLIKKMEDRPIEEQIIPLRELKKYEYIEEWAYELATLYHKADMQEECIEECKDIIIWFGSGDYVKRAELLKGYHEGKVDLFSLLEEKNSITSDEEEKVDNIIGKQEEKVDNIIEKQEEIKNGKETLDESSIDLTDDFLTEYNINYKEIFGTFLEDDDIKYQIIEILKENKNDNRAYYNFIITSNNYIDKEENTSFAKIMLTAFYKLEYISCNKVGVIDAETFNKIESAKKKKALRNCSLIIESAPLLEEDAIDEIEELILNSEQNIVFVLQGKSDEIDQLFEKHPQLYLYFYNRINL